MSLGSAIGYLMGRVRLADRLGDPWLILLLNLPESVFGYVAPVLIVVAILLVIFQPRLSAWAKARQSLEHITPEQADLQKIPMVLYILVFLIGVYGGYFGAAQGVLLIGLLSALTGLSLLRINVVKNVLAPAANFVAALVFAAVFSVTRFVLGKL